LNNDYLTSNALFLTTGAYITDNIELKCSFPFIRAFVKELASTGSQTAVFSHISFKLGVPSDLRLKVTQELKCEYVEHDEGYVIEIHDDRISVYSESVRGLFYGAVTLSKLTQDGYVNHGLLYNYPLCSIRGLKLYLPASVDIAYFKTYVDMLCRYKYNTVMLEVGGAMEYKSHPEINAGWVRYCTEMSEYSGKTVLIQEQTYPWYKNSIHVENGGGQFLSQEQVKDLVRYCKERFLDVIPEMPSLSHCDYLLINHPELAERKNDPYPDTYCPSDPQSYELLFDLLKEVLDVFEPEIVHVGHDELYSVGLCDKCKGQPAERLYADDLRKISDFLQQRGVKTMIWCEKLINAVNRNGDGFGGAARRMTNYETGEYFGENIPQIYQAIDLVPQSVYMLHWYWGMDKDYDKLFLDRGMHLTYGNFDGPSFADWKERLHQGAQGGIISNWSSIKEGNLQRNGILFAMAYSAYMFWRDDYDDTQYEATVQLALESLFHDRYRSLLNQAATASGTSYIEVLHTTDESKEYIKFFDGIFLENEEYRLGEYVLTYEDHSEVNVPIIYGLNISNKNRSWNRTINREDTTLRAQYDVDNSLFEASSTTLPVRIGEETFYKWLIENPYPLKTVANIRLIVDDPASYNIIVKAIQLVPPSEAFASRHQDKKQIRIRGEGTLA
jgi:hexosaminidase